MKSSNICITLTSVFILSISLAGGLAFAADDQNEVSDLKKQVEILTQRINELEQNKQAQVAQTNSSSPSLSQNRGMFWDPFAEMMRMQQEMDRMFQGSFSRFDRPQGIFSSDMSFDYDLNLEETDDGYQVMFDMTGLDQDKVDIQINDQSITVKGEKNSQTRQDDANGVFSAQSYGSFMKTIPVPVDADTSQVKTEKLNNQLVIHLPKKK